MDRQGTRRQATSTVRSIIAVMAISVIASTALIATLVSPNYHLAISVSQKLAIPANSPFNHVVTILMENNGYCDVMTTCGGGGTYETSLAQNNSITGACTSDSSCTTGGYTATSHPSEPNYVALLGGSTNGVTTDGICCYTLSQVNLIDRIEGAGLAWSAWAENATGTGTCSFTPPRNGDHFPFKVFSDMNTPPRCSRFLTTTAPTSPNSPGDPEFVKSLNSSAPNLVWLTPTDCDNGHNSCGVPCGPSNGGGGCAGGGDAYLANLVPRILSSQLFSTPTNKAALFILYDEGGGTSPTDFLYGSWSGSVVKSHFMGVNSYNHYSWSKTFEYSWGLPCMSNDCSANAMTEFFNPVVVCPPLTGVGFSYSPGTLGQPTSFTGESTGGFGPMSYQWNFGDGAIGSGQQTSHTYVSSGNYVTSLTIKDNCPNGQQTKATRSIVVIAGSGGGGGLNLQKK